MDPDSTLYSGYYKVCRLEIALDKLFNFIGKKPIDLHTADFKTLEKLAILNDIEKTIESSIENYSNDKRKVETYRLLLRIKKTRPPVTGFLNKSRLFYLTNNTMDGIRLLTKPNLRRIMCNEFPHCFRYDSDDISDIWQGELVKLLKFNPYEDVLTPVVKTINVIDKSPITAIIALSIGIIIGIIYSTWFWVV